MDIGLQHVGRISLRNPPYENLLSAQYALLLTPYKTKNNSSVSRMDIGS